MFLRPPDIKPKILGLWGLSGLLNCQCLPFINAVLFEWSGIRDHVFQSTTAESAPSVRFCNPWHGFCHSPNIHSARQSFLFFFFFFHLNSVAFGWYPFKCDDESCRKTYKTYKTSATHQTAVVRSLFLKVEQTADCSSAYFTTLTTTALVWRKIELRWKWLGQ